MAGKTTKPEDPRPKTGGFALKLMAGDPRIKLEFPVPESYSG